MSDAPPDAAPFGLLPFGRAEFQAATGAGEAAMEALEHYRVMLATWNERLNLVGPSALAEFWLRHAYDSAQLLALAPGARAWADLGSGAGLPGVVLAVLLRGEPDVEVHLVDSLAKRCRFLGEVVETLDLPAHVHHARSEDLRLKVEVVAARACAPLSRLLSYARPHLRPGVVGLFLKGRDAQVELTDARRSWRVEATLLPSATDPEGRIVKVERLARA